MKFILFIASFCIGFAIRIFPEETFENRWENYLEKSYSSYADERMEALDYFIKSNGKNSLVVLRNRLSIETNQTLRTQLIDYFDGRKSKEDFYDLLLFLKTSRDTDNAKKCMKLLYKINSARLRFELVRLFEKSKWEIYALIFIQSISSPTTDDVQWFEKIFHKYRIAKFWLSLSHKRDNEIIRALPPYYKNNFFTKRFTNYTLYWLIRYRSYYKIPIEEKLFHYINLPIVESFSEKHQKIFLKNIESRLVRFISFNEWLTSNSEAIVLWTLKVFLRESHKLPNQRKDAFTEVFLTKLKKEKSNFVFRAILSFRELKHIVVRGVWSKEIQNIIDQKCEQANPLPLACFTYFLQFNEEIAYNKWVDLSPHLKEVATLENLSTMMKQEKFMNSDFNRWALLNKDFQIRHHFISLIDLSTIKENIILFTEYLKRETKNSTKMILIYKIITSPELIKLFLPVYPSIRFYL